MNHVLEQSSRLLRLLFGEQAVSKRSMRAEDYSGRLLISSGLPLLSKNNYTHTTGKEPTESFYGNKTSPKDESAVWKVRFRDDWVSL
eukprot:scaffold178695_cov61-Attheya_sp.AAC.1